MLVAAMIALVLYVRATTISEANPVLLTAAQGPIEELSQWKKIWKQPENEFKKAEIVLDEPDLLKVRFEYRYAGGHEGKVFACGAIGIRKEHVKWSCHPTHIW